MKLCNVIKLVRGTLLRDTPAGRGIRLCNVVKHFRGTWQSGHRSRGT